MSITATIRCAKGHEQKIHYGDSFSRDYVEHHCVLMCGGELRSIGRQVPGMGGCAWFPPNGGETCGAALSFTIEEK